MNPEYYTRDTLADELGENTAAEIFRRTYPHHDFFRNQVIHRDQVVDQLAQLQSEEHHDNL